MSMGYGYREGDTFSGVTIGVRVRKEGQPVFLFVGASRWLSQSNVEHSLAVGFRGRRKGWSTQVSCEGPLKRLESGTGQIVDAVQGRNDEQIQTGFRHTGLEGFQPPSIFVIGDSQHTETHPAELRIC